MLFTNLAWILMLAGAAFVIVSLARRVDSNSNHVRSGGFLLIALAAVGVLTASMAAPDVLAASGLPLVLTISVGAAAVAAAGLRTPRSGASKRTDTIATESLWADVGRALAESPSLDSLLMAAASAIRSATDSKTAVVYKIAREGRDTILVGSTHREFDVEWSEKDHGDLRALARRSMADARVAVYRRGNGGGRFGLQETVWGLVPLQNGETVYGAILLESPSQQMAETANTSALTAVGQLVGRAVEDCVETAAGLAARTLLERARVLLAELSTEKAFERSLPCIARALAGFVDADFLSLAWLDRAQYHEDRVSMVVDDQKILDQRRRWPIWEGTTRKLMDTQRPLITPDLALMPTDDASETQVMEQRLGYRSRIVVPIRVADHRTPDRMCLIGTLTLAHEQAVRYGEDEARPLELIATVVGSWLTKLEAHRAAEEAAQSMEVIAGMEREPAARRSDEELLRTILPAVGSAGLRLYRFIDDGQTLRLTAGVGQRREVEQEDEARSQAVPLSQMPWHRWVLSDGTPRRVDQGDPESLMDEREVRSTMISNMKTAWIVPVRVGDKTLGFLDAMEVRDPDRQNVSPMQRLILTSAARLVGRNWSHEVGQQPAHMVNAACRRQLKALNGTVVNPITGIIGSVELIRHKQTGLTPETIKYLNLIEHSATRIHEALLGTLDDIPSDKPEQAVERSETMARRLFGALALPAGREKPVVTEGPRRLVTSVPVPAEMADADRT